MVRMKVPFGPVGGLASGLLSPSSRMSSSSSQILRWYPLVCSSSMTVGDSALFSLLSSSSWEIRSAALSLGDSAIGSSAADESLEEDAAESIDIVGELFGNSSSAMVVVRFVCLPVLLAFAFVCLIVCVT